MLHRAARFIFKRPTKEAALLRKALKKRGLYVRTELYDGFKHIDLGLPAARMNIEIDGAQHLTDPNQIMSDLSRTHFSDLLGYETFHIPNYEINSRLESIADAVAEAAIKRAIKIQHSKHKNKSHQVR